MTPEEASCIMHEQGWFYKERTRYKSRTKYVYAKRRQGKIYTERYICPLSKLGSLTRQELVTKLASQPLSEAERRGS
jgi:hypothetical protein